MGRDAVQGGRGRRWRGIEESREPVSTALGKMSGCLPVSGLVLTVALLLGFAPEFA